MRVTPGDTNASNTTNTCVTPHVNCSTLMTCVTPHVNCSALLTKNPWDDATWILTSAFIIFTMQSGFGLLESGTASRKNEVNIMVKNAVDVIFGGLSYWMLGYGLSFGESVGTNAFCGFGDFLLDADDMHMGVVFSHFLFQASFATTATTIVSGAMAERCRLEAYVVFSFFNTFIFCFPAHWVWAQNGWLKRLQVVDIAGDGPVHLVGGVTSLVAAIMLKPRQGRFSKGYDPPPMGSPTNALLGMFMLWWGWLGFNCGSTFGISGGKWKLAARAAVSTIMSSIGGVTGVAWLHCLGQESVHHLHHTIATPHHTNHTTLATPPILCYVYHRAAVSTIVVYRTQRCKNTALCGGGVTGIAIGYIVKDRRVYITYTTPSLHHITPTTPH